MGESRAVQRLRLVLESTAATGDHSAWLRAATTLQDVLARQEPDGAGRAALRAGMREACDVLRAVPRSRIGRQWGAVTADLVMGPVLRDVLDDPVLDPAEVLDLAECGRGRVLLDVLCGHFHGTAGNPREAELSRSVMSFSADRGDSDAVRREMRLLSAVRPLSMDEEGMGRREAAVAEVEALYAGRALGFEGSADAATLAQVQARLGPDEVLVEYVIPYHHLHPAYSVAALVITSDAAEVVDVPVGDDDGGFIGAISLDGRAPLDASPLGQLVLSGRLAVQGDDPGRSVAFARRLHEVLVEPVVATGLTQGRSSWVVVPHRQLHPVPWMALVDEHGMPWLLDHSVIVCPSASVWYHLAGLSQTSRAAFALGDPLLRWAGLQPLPGASAEVDHLRAEWQKAGRAVDARTGSAATAKALLTESSGAGLVHLATHGSAPVVGAGVDQSILLGLAAGTPGAVGVDALLGTDLHAAWLLSLSICDGGLYFVGQGDELLGLVGAALEAGAGSVVAAQWALDDAAGRRLMSRVVEALAAGADPARAIRLAALAQASDGAPMRDWAPFVLTGSGRGPA